MSGVQVGITHVPTGRTQIQTSNSQGSASARGLAVGGPYEVSVVGSNQYAADVLQNIYLELDKTAVVDLDVRPIIEEVLVTAQAPTGDVAIGVGRAFDRARIDATPSISRDFISALATDPKILVDNSVARGPAVSVAGANFRYNNLTVDGVAQNDNFGLSKNASATQRSPISIDAIEALTVNVAPYDVTYGSFIGGNINIVTKSGTNEFEGSVFAFLTDDSFTGDKSDGEKLGISNFDEETYGFTLGGPIVKDKLFFFANYEKFETTRPSNSQTIENIVGVTQQDVDDVIEIFQTEYGFDPGTFDASDVDEDEKFLIKLDWNINDEHRAVASYQRAEGDVLFDDFPDLAVLQTNRYDINEKLDAFSLQVFSNWTDNLSTEFKYGTKEVENRQVSIDSSTPDFAISTDDGGTITAGGDRFRHNNQLDNESEQLRFKADFAIGNHILTAGYEREVKKTANTFVPFTRGQFQFASIDDFRNRNISLVLFGGSTSGVVADAVGVFDLTTDSLFVQDEWIVTDELTFKFGLRFDEHSNSDDVPLNPDFTARNGFDNTFNLDGNSLTMPRFGFDWTPTDRLTVRGGAGLFGGGEPLIMLSNSYQGNGVTRNIVCGFCSFVVAFGLLDELAAGLPSPTIAEELLQSSNGVNPDSDVEAIAPNFETLSTWKYSLGLDYLADFSRIGLGDDWDLSADVVYSDVNHGFNVTEARRSVVGSAPDGRNIYDNTPGGDYILENTSSGGSTVFTVNLAKSWDTSYGLVDLGLGYTSTDAQEVRSYNRFVTFESFAFDATSDFNNMSRSTSKYEVPERITATLDWAHTLFGDNTTRASLVYIGRSGRNYSYVFGSDPANATFGGTFLADYGSEQDNPGSHLFYVPTGSTDPIVTGDPTFLANLNSFIDNESCLKGKRGEIVARNSCRTDFTNIVSLRLAQEIKVFGDKSLELILDIENIGNMINDDWGRVASYSAPSNVALAKVTIAGGQYVYAPVSSSQVSPGTIKSQAAIARLPSVYRIQFGVNFRF